MSSEVEIEYHRRLKKKKKKERPWKGTKNGL
jgi:hypothetical protein